MANLVISGIGAAAGGMIGGPTGAQLGWLLGSYLSSNSAENMPQQTIGDLRVQTSSYGKSIPIVFGKQRISGNIIWAADKTTYSINQGGGGKGGGPSAPAATGYKVDMAIALCKGPIEGISKIWADGKLIVDTSGDAKTLIGQLYTGTNTQLPDPTMESALGAGNVPAYRGLAYIVLNDFDLGVSGRVPMFSFEVNKQGGI